MEREFLTAGTAAKMFEPKGQITSRTGLAEVPLKVNKGHSRGAAAASQSILKVTQAYITWQGYWRRHLQCQDNGARLPVLQEGFVFARVKTNREFF